ncbi:MAG: restriction endonuclease subunit S, partial [Campylobacterales bacterium]|nr:restriction endonuclease subunit S [Campylobacterales bacterium]
MNKNLYILPTSWVWRKFGDILHVERGGSPRPIDDYITTASDGINWIKIGDTKNSTKYIYETAEKIKPEGLKKSRLVVEGDFILSNSMSFGKPYIMKTTGCIHDGWLLLRPKNDNLDKEFLYYVLSSSFVYEQFKNKASGTTVKNLNSSLVKDVDIPLPPLEEQRRIVGKLDGLFAKIDKSIAL